MPPIAIKNYLRSALQGIGSLFFPDLCPCCQREEEWERCIELWHGGVSTRFIGHVPILSVVAYDDRAKSVVLAAKERGERRAKEFLASAISSAVSAVGSRTSSERKLLFIPIPSSERAIRRRGEDVILELAQRVAIDQAPYTVLLPVLRWKREIRDQSELTIRERIINLDDSLEVDERRLTDLLRIHGISRAEISGRDLGIILIDDVITSGSTMAAAISAISHSSLGKCSTLTGITACHSARGL